MYRELLLLILILTLILILILSYYVHVMCYAVEKVEIPSTRLSLNIWRVLVLAFKKSLPTSNVCDDADRDYSTVSVLYIESRSTKSLFILFSFIQNIFTHSFIFQWLSLLFVFVFVFAVLNLN